MQELQTLARGTAAAVAPRRRWWGLDLTDLHDRLWASRGVQVVRPGSHVEERGPSMYLLLGDADLVVFDPEHVRKSLVWLKPRALRVRIVDREDENYRETIAADESDQFLRVSRDYRARTRRTIRCYLTPDAQTAQLWSEAADARTARLAMRRRIGREGLAPASIRGRIFSRHSKRDEPELLSLLLSDFSRLGAVLEGVYEFAPRVWLHDSSPLPADARLFGPLWIGAGVELPRGAVVVGPKAICDAPGVDVPVAPIAWDQINLPNWPFHLPTLKGRRLRRITKRLFDIVFSIFVLLVTAPLYPIVTLAILIEDGWPPFFAHRRQSIAGREFPCLKFRTMRKDAEKIKAELAARNQADGPQFFIRNDPRLLRIGGFLRRYQIDELPQFINVLLGHMSVVGPRPSPDNENQYCPAWREARLSVRPGVTGLWQIRRTRAPETDFQEWIRYDLEYVQHESWKMDLWIIARTIKGVLFG